MPRTDKFNWNDYKLREGKAKNIKINNNVQFVEKFARQKMIKHEDLNDLLLIIAGSDNYPKILLKQTRNLALKTFMLLLLKVRLKKLNLADSISWIKVGEFQKMLNILTQLDFKYGMMVGQISPKNIFP